MAKIIAHRGASSEAPENTLSSIRRALEIGVDYIELDVHLTRDGVPVISHDPHIKSHTASTLPIEAMTLAQLKEFDVGHWFDKDFVDERIPTLAEVLALPRGTTSLMIELKKSGSDSFLLVQKTLEAIDLAQPQPGKLLIGSFDLEMIAFVQQLKPSQPLIGLMESLELVEQFKKMSINHMAFDFALLDQTIIHNLKKEGITVWTYTVDDPAHIQLLIQQRIDGIITNDPNKAREFLP